MTSGGGPGGGPVWPTRNTENKLAAFANSAIPRCGVTTFQNGHTTASTAWNVFWHGGCGWQNAASPAQKSVADEPRQRAWFSRARARTRTRTKNAHSTTSPWSSFNGIAHTSNQAARSGGPCAHLRALRSATMTSAEAPSSAAWHHAIQHPLRRAADGILRATAPTAFIMMRRCGTSCGAVTWLWTSFTPGASAPFFSRCLPPLSKRVTSPRGF